MKISYGCRGLADTWKKALHTCFQSANHCMAASRSPAVAILATGVLVSLIAFQSVLVVGSSREDEEDDDGLGLVHPVDSSPAQHSD